MFEIIINLFCLTMQRYGGFLDWKNIFDNILLKNRKNYIDDGKSHPIQDVKSLFLNIVLSVKKLRFLFDFQSWVFCHLHFLKYQ